LLRWGVAVVVIKNWHPLLLGPEFCSWLATATAGSCSPYTRLPSNKDPMGP
jgi:hypothetical protein